MPNNHQSKTSILNLRRTSRNITNRIRLMGNSQKIFCIGLNKTGTTSVKKAWQHLGFIVGNQSEARNLLDPWLRRDFQPIINYCKSAQAFQDSPFSFPYTYIALDQAFPDSKFILTIRDDAEQWYRSITRFHGKKWSNGAIPTKDDLMNAVNGTKGRPWKVNRALFGTPEDEPYQKDKLIAFYDNYINEVKQYFKYRATDLLIINVANNDSYVKFWEFIGKIKLDIYPSALKRNYQESS